MRVHGFVGNRFAVCILAVAGLVLAGCGSDVKDGTQVQISEETKAQIQDMRDVYKDMGKNKTKD